MKIKIRAFRAINELETCNLFSEGHVKILTDYGITNITTNNTGWMSNPNMYCIIASSFDETEILGGIRLQISDDENYLPVELAIGKMDDKIYPLIKKLREDGGVGELCALWNTKKIAGVGISMLLTRAGISIVNQLNIKTLVGICADYTLKMFEQVGFVVNKSLGVNGEFLYPNENYKARVLGILNAVSLENTAEFDKARIRSMRENPIQNYVEIGSKNNIEINYNLSFIK
jgi:hypothetical protein